MTTAGRKRGAALCAAMTMWGAVASAQTALVAEPQTPTGKFTTATEVRPILTATRSAWIAVRDYDGQDLLYVTHLWSWRCGLLALRIGVNGGQMTDWPLPPCHLASAQPNGIKEGDGLPYVAYPGGSLQRIEVQIVYDDLGMDWAVFDRNGVEIP